MRRNCLRGVVCFLFVASLASAQERFSQTVGNVSAQPVATKTPIEIPYITWGGDVATFHANGGGLATKSGSIYDKLGLKMKLTAGDDFVGQVRNYVSGKTPFLRGTFRMLGQASEVLGNDPRTKPVVIMQLSWSAGDHIVSRDTVKTLNDLRSQNGKKAKIACQKGGPHVGLLYDSLKAVNIPHTDIEIVWVDDLTGPKGPAAKFRSDPTITACCVITPDMLGLTGGVDSKGTGAEGTVKDAKVLNSTQTMSRSIADVYAVRKDWYQANREFVTKFVSGYLKATEDVVAMRNGFEKSGRLQSNYQQLLKSAQTIFGADVLPTLEVDAHGLLLDCTFVGVPGQIAFFEDSGNLDGFNAKMSNALDLATGWGYANARLGFDPPGFDYESLTKLSGAKYIKPAARQGRFGPEDDVFTPIGEDTDTIFSFTINFDVNDPNFSADRFGAEFQRAIQAASTFGNAIVQVRGHADPTKTLREFVMGGKEKKTIRVTGQQGNYRYYLRNGQQLDLTQTETIVKLIQSGQFETPTHKPMRIVQAALNLSKARADKVKSEIVKFAEKQAVNLDPSQIKPVGAGVSEPIVPRPINRAQAAENRRVEFRIVRVPAEALTADEFDF